MMSQKRGETKEETARRVPAAWASTNLTNLYRFSTSSLPRATVRHPHLIFSVPAPSMSEKLNLTCFACQYSHRDEPDEHTIQVKLDPDDTVSSLKKLFKNEYTHRFAGYDACDLILWKCSIPIDDNLKENLKKIRFDGTDPSVQRIRTAASEISEHFPTILPYKTIQILVLYPW